MKNIVVHLIKKGKGKRTFAKAYVHICILETLRFWEYKGKV